MNTFKTFLVGSAIAAAPLVGSMALALPAHATTADLTTQLGNVNSEAGLGNQDLTTTIGLLINVLLGFLGVIFLVLIIYAGFLWMTAAGKEDQVDKAKDILITSVVGLVILLSAYAISSFVIGQLSSATATG